MFYLELKQVHANGGHGRRCRMPRARGHPFICYVANPTFSRLAAQAESELRDEPESDGSIARAKT